MEDRIYNNFRTEIENREMEIKKRIDNLKNMKKDLIKLKDYSTLIKTLDSIYEKIYEENVFLLKLIDKNARNEVTLRIDELAEVYNKIRGSAKVLDNILKAELSIVYFKNFSQYL